MKQIILILIIFLSACEYGTKKKIHYHDIYIHKIILYINGNCSLIKINDFEYSDLPQEYSELKPIGFIDKIHGTLDNPIKFQISKLTNENISHITAELYINNELYTAKTITDYQKTINFIITEL